MVTLARALIFGLGNTFRIPNTSANIHLLPVVLLTFGGVLPLNSSAVGADFWCQFFSIFPSFNLHISINTFVFLVLTKRLDSEFRMLQLCNFKKFSGQIEIPILLLMI